MSVPELFHHQRTFIGCLSARWPSEPGAELWLATRAFDTGLSGGCPALDASGRCSLHDDRKPAVCQVVPFDERLPDRLQHLVLAARAREAEYMGSDCIVAGSRAGFPVVTRRLELVDDSARRALTTRRRDLENEQRFWGEALTPLLRAELLAGAAPALPPNGFLTLSIAPVLLVLVQASKRSRERCMAYLLAQATLCERTLQQASSAGSPQRAALGQLAALARTNARLLALLAAAPPPGRTPSQLEGASLERWLGLD